MRVRFHILYYCPIKGDRARALSSACSTDQADITDQMPFLPSSLMEEINLNKEPLKANTNILSSAWKS